MGIAMCVFMRVCGMGRSVVWRLEIKSVILCLSVNY